MNQPINRETAKQRIEQIVLELIEYSDYISFSQLRRIAGAVPFRLSGALLLSLVAFLGTVFSFGWQAHRLFGMAGDRPPVEQLSPEATVSQYYALLSSGQHGKAWKILAKGQYEPWISFWTTVEHVSVSDPVTLSETTNQAVVQVNLRYLKKDGPVINELTRLYLVRDSDDKPWKISKAERIKTR